ncbi:MAG TPA: HEPN domain-containing protein [Candidatus Kapabacteria bacterium]|nr:HEPN domain-containing protein [Candidatus Kapabacteria bacterium]
MINIQKQIDYWEKNADEDIQTAEILINQKRFLHGMFFCHLSIEKILKAHYVKSKESFAPKTHNLFYLSEHSGLFLENDTNIFLGVLMKYQLEGRYPEYNQSNPDYDLTIDYLNKTKELLKCLKLMLLK